MYIISLDSGAGGLHKPQVDHGVCICDLPPSALIRVFCSSRSDVPVFAMSLGLAAEDCGGVPEGLGLSPGLTVGGVAVADLARKFLATDTLLNVSGFFTEFVLT